MEQRSGAVRAHVRLTLLSGMMGLGAFGAAAPVWALAGDLRTAVPIEIPRQDLASALSTFANQADVQILFAPDAVASMRSPAVSGTYPAENALKLLLSGSDLEYVVTGTDSVLVRRRAVASDQRATVSDQAPARAGAPGAIRLAQTPEPQGPARSSAKPRIEEVEEIIVTAQKRTQSLEDVPLSISVIEGDRLEQRDIRNLEELSTTTPNIKITQGGQADQLQIRGVGSGFNPGFEQAVGTFVDGLYRSRSRAVRASLFDLERVEVLKGPQSTFFGNNAIAGALNITTRKPANTFEGNSTALYSPNDGEYNAEAGASLPISNTLSARVAGKFSGMKGYIDDSYTGKKGPHVDDKLGRVTFAWTPSEAFDAMLRSEYGDLDDQAAFNYELLNCPPPAAFGAAAGACARYITVAGAANVDSQLNYNSPSGTNFFKYKYSESGLTMNAHVAGLTLTSVTGFFHHDMDTLLEATGVPLASPFNAAAVYQASAGRDKINQLSEELRLTSPTGGLIDYMAGLYYQRARTDFETVAAFYQTNYGAMPAVAPYFPSGSLIATDPHSRQKDETKSVFGAATVHVAESMRFNLGLRYSDVDKTFTRTNTVGTSGLLPNVDNFAPGPLAGQKVLVPLLRTNITSYDGLTHKDSKLMPSASVQYDVTSTSMAYLSYANGFKAGGFSFNTTATAADTGEFKAETVNSYELGLKASWLDKKLTTNLAIFHMKYNNLQETTAVVLPGSTTFVFVVSNVAASTSQGVELGVLWQPTSQLKIGTELAYLDAKYDSFNAASCTALQGVQTPVNCSQNLSGRTRAFAPRYTGSLSADYQLPVTATLRVNLGADAYYTDDFYLQANLDPYLRQDAYTKVGARLGFGTLDGTWDVSVIGKNLSDKTTTSFRQAVPGSPGSVIALPDRPRSVALQARYRW
jgi:iron complex outermembrane receptor protein